MQIIEVNTASEWAQFHRVPHHIYANDPHWIAHLESDVRKVFDPQANKTFTHGQARCWVLQNEAGQGIGRIAAFIDGARNEKKQQHYGGIGFFESINNDAAANKLFETAESYLREQGMDTIQAPINFGERDKFWGLLIKGWYPPLYHENYNPKYYLRFFEQRGYQPQEQVFTFGGKVNNLAFHRLKSIAPRVRERYGIQSRHFDLKNLRKSADDMATVYNSAFQHMPHFKPLHGEQLHKMLLQMKPIMDPILTCIAYAGEQPVGFCALMPDLNYSLAFTKGKLSWWKYPRFFWNLKRLHPKVVKGVAFGIHADYQRKGVFSEMVEFMSSYQNDAISRKYDALGLATIRGGNFAMLKSSTAALNVHVERVHLSYVKLFDDAPYEPYGSSDISEVAWGNIPDESLYPTT